MFRSSPGRLTRHLARLPILLYRLRLGWLLGGRFLLLTHVGRKTGLQRRTMLEVVHHDADSATYFVAAAWGEKAQWLRNIQAHSQVEVTVGRRSSGAIARAVSQEEAERVLETYARQHRIAMRVLGRVLGSSDPHKLAQTLPIVAVRTSER